MDEGPHWTSSTMSRAEWRMKGARCRSVGVKCGRPSPEEREVPNSWVKSGVSVGEKIVK